MLFKSIVIILRPKPLVIIPPPVNGNDSSQKNGRVLLSKKFQPLIKVKQKPPSPKAKPISLASPIPSLEKEPKLSSQPIRFLSEEEFRHLPVYISQYFEDYNEINGINKKMWSELNFLVWEHVSNLNKMIQKNSLEYLNRITHTFDNHAIFLLILQLLHEKTMDGEFLFSPTNSVVQFFSWTCTCKLVLTITFFRNWCYRNSKFVVLTFGSVTLFSIWIKCRIYFIMSRTFRGATPWYFYWNF